jgi:hypothetical protein
MDEIASIILIQLRLLNAHVEKQAFGIVRRECDRFTRAVVATGIKTAPKCCVAHLVDCLGVVPRDFGEAGDSTKRIASHIGYKVLATVSKLLVIREKNLLSPGGGGDEVGVGAGMAATR